MMDSRGRVYTDLHTQKEPVNKDRAKNRFIENVNTIVELQAIAVPERTEKQRYALEKAFRRNESLIKTYLAARVKLWRTEGIKHLILEDLNLINDQGYYVHKDIKIKYTRLARLLRLGQIKKWMANLAEKQAMAVHLVPSAYTSQECSQCHFVSKSNRKNQESFCCLACGHTEHADLNSAKNIKTRIRNSLLVQTFCELNEFLCYRPKKTFSNHKKVRSALAIAYEKLGVVTEFPTPTSSKKKNKKGSPVL